MTAIFRLTVIGLTLSTLACDAPADDPSDVIFSETIGSMERVRADDPDSPWIGQEIVRIVDGRGELLCEGDVDLDAIGTTPCEDCEVTLDVLRSTVKDLGENCSFVEDASDVGTTSRYLSFEPSLKSGDFSAGRILQADSADGPWRDFAGGVFDGERIAYQRTASLQGAIEVSDPSDFRPRDLPTQD